MILKFSKKIAGECSVKVLSFVLSIFAYWATSNSAYADPNEMIKYLIKEPVNL
jgi:hypothetical protein